MDREERLAMLVASLATLFRKGAGEGKERCQRNQIGDLWVIGAALLHISNDSPPASQVLADYFAKAANRFGDKGTSYRAFTKADVADKTSANHRQFMAAWGAISLSVSETQVVRGLITGVPKEASILLVLPSSMFVCRCLFFSSCFQVSASTTACGQGKSKGDW